MLITSLVTALLFFQTPPNKIEPPPQPDFQTRVDYFAWWQRQVKGTFTDDQNAAPLLEKILVSPLDFNGPYQATGDLVPWTPGEHPDWEKSCNDSRATIAMFRQASEKAFYLNPRLERPKTLMDLALPELSAFRRLATHNLEHGWRAKDGKVDGRELVDAIKSNLNAARQIQRDPMLVSYLVSMAIRALSYDTIFKALNRDAFDPAARAELQKSLRDIGSASFELPLAGELASNLDALQWLKLDKGAIDKKEDPRDILGKLGGAAIDFPATRDALRDYFASIAKLYRGAYSSRTLANFDSELKKVKDLNLFTQMMLPKIDRAYILGRRAEATRRAVLVLLQLHAYHDKNQKWPAQLADLGKDAQYEILDPFTDNKPFVYKLAGDKFTLYSVAQNATDDGGTHDPKWGDEKPNTDYIFWPVQK